MKAIILKEQGDVSNLILAEIPIPSPAVSEVLIKVKAVAINPADTYIRKFENLDYVFNGERPRILGWDVAGVVTEIGMGVNEFKVGDEVFGVINYPRLDRPGHGKGYAEYVTASVGDLALKPANISFEQAAAATLAALTAWQPLQKAGITPGDRVLIAPAGGGVGHFAVQIAKSLGAHVIAITSGRKMDFVRSLGADELVDYTTHRFEDVIDPVDVVLDGLRDDHIGRSLKVVRPGGKLISLFTNISGTQWEKIAKELSVDAFYNVVESSGSDMKSIAGLLASGQIRPHVSKTFPLEQTADAHREMELDHAQGKIVLSLTD